MSENPWAVKQKHHGTVGKDASSLLTGHIPALYNLSHDVGTLLLLKAS